MPAAEPRAARQAPNGCQRFWADLNGSLPRHVITPAGAAIPERHLSHSDFSDGHTFAAREGRCMIRSILLFVHVAGAMGVFVALGMEALALAQLRRASNGGAVRAALGALGAGQRLMGPSGLLLVLSGIYLATAYWHWQGAWMGLGFLGMLAIGALGGIMTGRNVGRLRKELDASRASTSSLTVSPALWTSFAIRAALLVAVLYLMTVKPGPLGALAALGTALVVGLAVSRTTGSQRAEVALESGARP